MADDIRYFGPRPTDPAPNVHPSGPWPPRNPQQRGVGLTSVPDEVLLRHNAKVLDPKAAPTFSGLPAPRPTIYRVNELLMPAARRDSMTTYAKVLAKTGMTISEAKNEDGNPAGGEFFVKAVLTPIDPKKPTVVDAWMALQTLLSAVVEDQGPDQREQPHAEPVEEPEPTLTEEEVTGIGLNHLLIGTAMGGLGGASGVLQGVPGAVNGGPYSGGGSSGDDLGYWRRPVMLAMPLPRRQTDEEIAKACKRRPVIAVLDTGVAKNTWLGTPSDDPSDFAFYDEDLQKDIDLNNPGDVPGGSIDDPYTTEPLVGELSTHAGHGTFIMGLIQQAVPDARVLSIRVMHNDGIACSNAVAYALKMLVKRVDTAQSGTTDEAKAMMVDIVSLSLGNYLQGDFGPTELAVLTEAIDDLRRRGVIVVASAGNFASSRRFYPAALAVRTTTSLKDPDPAPNTPPVISVGALNPNRTKTLFSNDSDEWVTCWARGGSLISTFPEKTNAARGVAFRVEKRMTWPVGIPPEDPINYRESLESDDYTGGFAIWSGTSFAAPVVVGTLAQRLFDDKENNELGKTDTIERANRVIDELGGEKT